LRQLSGLLWQSQNWQLSFPLKPALKTIVLGMARLAELMGINSPQVQSFGQLSIQFINI
jgi:hypothetical protein